MEISQTLVRSAYQSLGYFIIEGIRIGVKEIDFLAVRIIDGEKVVERLHIESQISTNPIAPFRGQAKIKGAFNDPKKAAEEYINKKYENKKIVDAIKEYFSNCKYKRVLVYGKLKKPEQLKIFNRHGVETISISDLVNKAMSAHPTHELNRIISVYRVIDKQIV